MSLKTTDTVSNTLKKMQHPEVNQLMQHHELDQNLKVKGRKSQSSTQKRARKNSLKKVMKVRTIFLRISLRLPVKLLIKLKLTTKDSISKRL